MTRITCSKKPFTLGKQVPQVVLLVLSDYSPVETAVRLFEQAIECLADQKPCGKCASCSRVPWTSFADVSSFDSGQGLSKEGVMVIRQAAQSSGSEDGKPRVFVISGVEHMSPQAANTLLKFLEETPPGTFFILTTRQISKVLPTIISRSSAFAVSPEPDLFNSEVSEFCKSPDDLSLFLNACTDSGQARRLLNSEGFSTLKEACQGMGAFKSGKVNRLGLVNLIKALDYHELSLCRRYLFNFFKPSAEKSATVVNLDRKPLKVIVADDLVSILEGV